MKRRIRLQANRVLSLLLILSLVMGVRVKAFGMEVEKEASTDRL